jgi:hypothetical protein
MQHLSRTDLVVDEVCRQRCDSRLAEAPCKHLAGAPAISKGVRHGAVVGICSTTRGSNTPAYAAAAASQDIVPVAMFSFEQAPAFSAAKCALLPTTGLVTQKHTVKSSVNACFCVCCGHVQ